MDKPKIIVILGPTASGKSDMAVVLAKKFNGEVISADSRQVYRGMDIGTGKITRREMSGVKHHLLDVCSPKRRFSAADYVSLTNQAIAEIVIRKKVPVICGGTGFYVDALLGDKQIPEVPPNWELRKKMENKSTGELFEMLRTLDSERAKNIDRHNPRRLVRAIEICKAVGKVPPRFTNLAAQGFGESYKSFRDKRYDVLKLGIKIPEEELKRRIAKRIEKWFRQGLIKEVKNLRKKRVSWKRLSEIGLEYKLVSQYIKSEIKTLKSLKQKMFERTWQYAKRQMTWFKKDRSIVWHPPKLSQMEREASKFLK